MLNLAPSSRTTLLALGSLLSRRAKVGGGRAALVEEATEERSNEGVEDDLSATVVEAVSILELRLLAGRRILLTRTEEWPSRGRGQT